MRLPSILLLLGTGLSWLQAADWPTYRGDYARSGITTENLSVPLQTDWVFQSTHPPRPAWGGEARWDAYNKVYNLPHRQLFDKVFHVVALGERLYFGSSADDKVYCLDAKTGKPVWTWFTEGPVRLAPTLSGGRVFVGSDDGHVYCLTADTGQLVWKKRIGPRDYRIPGNGRVISAWPVRTSVVVQDGTAYCGAGMFPSEKVFITALDADTGAEQWSVSQTDLPAQGYLLASDTRLYVPTGRNNPIVMDRANGKRLRVVGGSGGTYALLTGDTLIFGPGKRRELGVIGAASKDQLATFSGNHMIVTPEQSYLHSDTELSALDRVRYIELTQEKRRLDARRKKLSEQLKKLPKDDPKTAATKKELITVGIAIEKASADLKACMRWKIPCNEPLALVLAGQTLVTGGDRIAAAYNTKDGKRLWQSPVNGRAFGLAVSHGRLFVSTDQGAIHCFTSPQQQAAK